jgi:site-specific recombinase XerD
MSPRTIPKTLTAEERTRLLARLHERSLVKLRALVICRLMTDLGLRGCEVCRLKVQDVDWSDQGGIIVNGKGAKQRKLWLSEENQKLLRRWREVRDKLPQANGYLITGLDGRPLKERNLRRIVKTALRRADLPQYSAHHLRHTFATDLMAKEKKLRLVQEALGHASVATTEIYLHVTDEEMETALKRLRA